MKLLLLMASMMFSFDFFAMTAHTSPSPICKFVNNIKDHPKAYAPNATNHTFSMIVQNTT